MIISFAWTTPALISGHKTVTRRDWTAEYASHFRAGQLVEAWSKQPRFHGALPVAMIELERDPYLERTDEAPDSDWFAEGFEYLQKLAPDAPVRINGLLPRQLWREWRGEISTGSRLPHRMWVVRFRVVGLVPEEMYHSGRWRELATVEARAEAVVSECTLKG